MSSPQHLSPELQAATTRDYPADWSDADTRAVDTARVLAAEAVQKCGSGHPGTAMSLAPLAYTLFQRVMNVDPNDTEWAGRDRFVLSPGHTSLTLYVQLFLGGFGLTMDDLKALRTWGSLTPGHPEYRHTKGIEITTGPLGQGLASAVGMAMATRRERYLFDPDTPAGESPFDHYIYVIASDGDMEEGVTSEASSLAGTQQLGNLIVFWDDNRISIEENTRIAFTEDVMARYRAYGWQVLDVPAGENVTAIEQAVAEAQADTTRPSFIRVRTVIGFPAPTKMNTGSVHGAALGADEVKATKEALGFDPEVDFFIDDAVLAHTRKLADRGAEKHAAWQKKVDQWAAANPDGKALFDRLAAGSNNTFIKGDPSFGPEDITTETWTTTPGGRNLHFGIREHAMGAIMNGIALHGGTRPYGGTFLIFSDYMRPAIRLAALMRTDAYYVWTHDSIGLGEDGPTHQPVEQTASLRLIPNMHCSTPNPPRGWRSAAKTCRSCPAPKNTPPKAWPVVPTCWSQGRSPSRM